MANAVSSKKSRNILRTRQTFYKRVQHENEPFTTFLNDLKHLIKHCHFKNCEESILRDRVIFGLHNAKLREEFIENGGDPKLEHIVGVCQFLERQREEQPSGSNAEVMARDGSENDFVQISHESMADLQEQDSVASDGIASASYLMANLSHEDSFFDESNQTILEKLPEEDGQLQETETKYRCEEKTEKEKKDCRRSMCVRIRKELKSIHEKVKKYKARNDTLIDLNIKMQLRLNRFENMRRAHGNDDDSNRISRLEHFLEEQNYGFPPEQGVLSIGDANVTLDDMKQIHRCVSDGTKKDSEFIRYVVSLLWTDEELIKRTVRSQTNGRLRECTPEKKDFLAKQLRLRAENEGYVGAILEKRTKASTINKILKTHIDRKEKRAKRKQKKDAKKEKRNELETSEE